MEVNQDQTHTKETFYYAISRMLERASFFGFRALVVLYMIGETLEMESTEALKIFGWVIGSLVFAQIFGGVLGDLLIGNKKSIILGAIVQAVGAFTLCIPSMTGLYTGLFLVVLGSGFFTPNIISNFGKTYLNKSRLLDAGFAIFYLAVNLGSFLGILLIVTIGEKYDYKMGFIISGILMLMSIIPLLLVEEKELNQFEPKEFAISRRIFNILFPLILVGLFWGFYEMSVIRTSDIQLQLSQLSTIDIPKFLWQSKNSILLLPISIIAIVLWTYFYNSQIFKLMLGFVFGAISFGILVFIPDIPTAQHAIAYLISLLFLSIAEIHIAPIIYSVLTKYSNPKYLAILISVAFLPTRLISLVFGPLNNKLHDNPVYGLKIGIIGMAIIGIGLIGYMLMRKKASQKRGL